MNLTSKKTLKIFMLYCIPLISLTTSMKSEKEMIYGYIERMNPAIILLEDIDEEIMIEKADLPRESTEGKWVDLMKSGNTYEVIRINENMTKEQEQKAKQLRKKLLKKAECKINLKNRNYRYK